MNPNHRQTLSDTRTIVLSEEQVRGMKDEEILSSMVRGFYGGWSFFPERCLVRTLWEVGWGSLIRCEFVGQIPYEQSPHLASPSSLTRTVLPPKGFMLFGRNFMVLDSYILPGQETQKMLPIFAKQRTELLATFPELGSKPVEVSNLEPVITHDQKSSYVDVAYGSNLPGRHFAGVHRFEVTRLPQNPLNPQGPDEEGPAAVEINYSSVSCDPNSNVKVFGEAIAKFHRLYALMLFVDCVDEVLRC